jgi:pimeloyl-ACP methyl ester carboxylesterase
MEETGPAWIVTHSQGAEPVLQAVRQRPDLAAALVLMEPSDMPDDPGFLARADIPVLLVSGDYLDRSALWRELDERFDQLIADIRGAGGRADRLDLTAAIGAGFSHMAMMDHGHDRVFDVVDAWLQKNGDPTAAVTDPQTLK